MQWAQFLAQDNIFWLYEIKNTGTTTYDQAVFGMLVGTYVGVTGSRGATAEYDDDWSFYDVQREHHLHGRLRAEHGRAIPGGTRTSRWAWSATRSSKARATRSTASTTTADADSSVRRASLARSSRRRASIRRLITRGQRIVLIQDDFTRVSFTVPNRRLREGLDARAEGFHLDLPGTDEGRGGEHRHRLSSATRRVNRNAYDGIDNNFNGLIDENQFLHYRQFKRNRNPPFQVLIDILRPVRYVDRIIAGPASTRSA